MNPPDNDSLLREILPGDQAEAFRASSLQHFLRAADQQRRRRSARHSVFSTSVAVVALLGLLLGAGTVRKGNQIQVATADNTPSPTSLPTQAKSAPVVRNGVRMLSDDELLDMFRGRRVALVGKPGQQQLVLLDQRPRKAIPPP